MMELLWYYLTKVFWVIVILQLISIIPAFIIGERDLNIIRSKTSLGEIYTLKDLFKDSFIRDMKRDHGYIFYIVFFIILSITLVGRIIPLFITFIFIIIDILKVIALLVTKKRFIIPNEIDYKINQKYRVFDLCKLLLYQQPKWYSWFTVYTALYIVINRPVRSGTVSKFLLSLIFIIFIGISSNTLNIVAEISSDIITTINLNKSNKKRGIIMQIFKTLTINNGNLMRVSKNLRIFIHNNKLFLNPGKNEIIKLPSRLNSRNMGIIKVKTGNTGHPAFNIPGGKKTDCSAQMTSNPRLYMDGFTMDVRNHKSSTTYLATNLVRDKKNVIGIWSPQIYNNLNIRTYDDLAGVYNKIYIDRAIAKGFYYQDIFGEIKYMNNNFFEYIVKNKDDFDYDIFTYAVKITERFQMLPGDDVTHLVNIFGAKPRFGDHLSYWGNTSFTHYQAEEDYLNGKIMYDLKSHLYNNI